MFGFFVSIIGICIRSEAQIRVSTISKGLILRMKLALVGNCQLEVIGNLFRNVASIHRDKITSVYNTPIYKLNAQKNTIDFFHELEKCDRIFLQYHSEKWGAFSTHNLSKYFDVTVLPTLESRVSTPQLGYFPGSLPDLMVYVDYRILHLYLCGETWAEAAKKYHGVAFSREKQLRMLLDDTDKYKQLFQEGKVSIDYSSTYLQKLNANFDCYSTISHPDNDNLTVLLSAVYQYSFGELRSFNLQGNGMLDNYLAPKIGSDSQRYFMMRETGLPLASKINFSFFDSQDKNLLNESLLSSAYYHSLQDQYQNM